MLHVYVYSLCLSVRCIDTIISVCLPTHYWSRTWKSGVAGLGMPFPATSRTVPQGHVRAGTAVALEPICAVEGHLDPMSR